MRLIGFTNARFLGLTLVILLCGFLLFREVNGNIPRTPLAVMTYNIGGILSSLNEFEEIVSVMESRGVPDVIFLQEVRGTEQAAAIAKRLKIRYYRYANYRGKKNSGIAILSKYALTDGDVLHYRSCSSHYGSLAVRTVIDGRKVLLCSVHLESIGDTLKGFKRKGRMIELSWLTMLDLAKKELFEDTVRHRSARELLTWLSSYETDNVIIGGDFNTFPLSKPIRMMNAAYDDVLWPSFSYFSATETRLPPINARFDYLFHSENMKVDDACIIRKGPGDHYAVRAVFDIDPQISQITRIR